MTEKSANTPIPGEPAKAPDTKSTETSTSPKEEIPKEEVKEIGGPRGPEPTRYNDWERNGRCSDF
ncbi:DUF1674 domain-containing protein [Rhodospirillum sp. A1_3_36]|uniref:DUF1674 domain-containing protein n=1 Tax=Rhodospirillum sp. A1_3_36 TaxID=3391666 RepID=UPI0039A74FF8